MAQLLGQRGAFFTRRHFALRCAGLKELARAAQTFAFSVPGLAITLTGTVGQVRKTPSWPRSWANFSLLSLYSHRNPWTNFHRLGQPNTFLSLQTGAPAAGGLGLRFCVQAEGDTRRHTSAQLVKSLIRI